VLQKKNRNNTHAAEKVKTNFFCNTSMLQKFVPQQHPCCRKVKPEKKFCNIINVAKNHSATTSMLQKSEDGKNSAATPMLQKGLCNMCFVAMIGTGLGRWMVPDLTAAGPVEF
jgi:hypothetical protein